MQLLAKLLLALLAVGLMAGLVVFGRAYRDAGRLGGPLLQTETVANDLSARPLILPALGPGDQCPLTPLSQIDSNFPEAKYWSFMMGTGPIYFRGAPPSRSAWGTYFRLWLYSAPDLNGPVLVRGRELRKGAPVIFVGEFADGPVQGTDVLSGSRVVQYPQLLLPVGATRSNLDRKGWGKWPTTMGLAPDQSSCVGLQVDGKDFSETVINEYLW